MGSQDSQEGPSAARASKAAQRFVPWEPYKAAVASAPTNGPPRLSPLQSEAKLKYPHGPVLRKSRKGASEDEGSRDPQVAVVEKEEAEDVPGHQSALDTLSIRPPPLSPGPNERDEEKLARRYQQLRLAYERLAVEKESLGDQLSVEAEKNAELKRLVIASMGEDLGTHMDCMSHNKAQLAQNIVAYTRELSAGAEEMDRMGIQAELWRTKYLAASVMVDELVNWRLFLVRKLEETQAAILRLLQDQEASNSHIHLALLLLKDIRGALEPLGSAASPPQSIAAKASEQSAAEAVQELCGLADGIHAKLLDRGKEAPPSLADLDPSQLSFAPSAGATWALRLAGEDASAWLASSPCQSPPDPTHRRRRLKGIVAAQDRNLTLNCCSHCHGEIHVV